MSEKARLARIAEAHHKHVDAHGGNYGTCAECEMAWPCPTYAWATTDRNAAIDCWDPRNDEDDHEHASRLLSVEGKETNA